MEGKEYQRRQTGLPSLLTLQIILLNSGLENPLQFFKTFISILSYHEQDIIISCFVNDKTSTEEWNDMLRATQLVTVEPALEPVFQLQI